MRKVVKALREAEAKRITFLAIADATNSNPDHPYNQQNDGAEIVKVLKEISDKLDKLDEIVATLRGIEESINAQISDTETRMVLKARPEKVMVVLKPDLLPGESPMADAVFIYQRDGKTVARIVEAKAVWGKNTTWDRILKKLENTQGYIEKMAKEGRLPSVQEYEHVVVVRLSNPPVPPENVKVMEINPEEVEGEGERKLRV